MGWNEGSIRREVTVVGDITRRGGRRGARTGHVRALELDDIPIGVPDHFLAHQHVTEAQPHLCRRRRHTRRWQTGGPKRSVPWGRGVGEVGVRCVCVCVCVCYLEMAGGWRSEGEGSEFLPECGGRDNPFKRETHEHFRGIPNRPSTTMTKDAANEAPTSISPFFIPSPTSFRRTGCCARLGADAFEPEEVLGGVFVEVGPLDEDRAREWHLREHERVRHLSQGFPGHCRRGGPA